jgi:Mrp family chromosome partitioning ATPase
MGFQTAVLDADVTGPSIPRAFGLKKGGESNEMGLLPVETRTGIRVMSVNLLLEKEDAPVVWRGPVISGVIQQFWKDVAWGTVDFLFVDMPPGTGDVALTVFQSLPVDGIIIVTTPQDLVTMIVKKAFRMAEMMNIPVLGLIENMSWLACPDCGRVIEVFGKSTVDAVAADLGVPVLAKLPIESRTAALIDTGACGTREHRRDCARRGVFNNPVARIVRLFPVGHALPCPALFLPVQKKPCARTSKYGIIMQNMVEYLNM